MHEIVERPISSGTNDGRSETQGLISSNSDDLLDWEFAKAPQGKGTRLAEIGRGQVPVGEAAGTRAAVSFARVTQRATVSFAQLCRVEVGRKTGEANAAARALLVALGLHAHLLAFGRGFALTTASSNANPHGPNASLSRRKPKNGTVVGAAKGFATVEFLMYC